eukprot:scaffold54609_cov71-Phaeocystis_antarctica.AAC.5
MALSQPARPYPPLRLLGRAPSDMRRQSAGMKATRCPCTTHPYAARICTAEGVSSPLRARHAEVCGSRHAEVCGSSVPGGSSGGLVVCVELAESSGCRPCTASTASTAGMALGGSRSP